MLEENPGRDDKRPAAAEQTTPAEDQPASQLDEGRLLEALRQVVDPELMINIVDLGLVY